MDINLFDEALNGLKAKGICGTKWVEIYTALRFDCRPFTSVVEINCLFEIPYISGQEFRKSHLFPFACCVFCLGTWKYVERLKSMQLICLISNPWLFMDQNTVNNGYRELSLENETWWGRKKLLLFYDISSNALSIKNVIRCLINDASKAYTIMFETDNHISNRKETLYG